MLCNKQGESFGSVLKKEKEKKALVLVLMLVTIKISWCHLCWTGTAMPFLKTFKKNKKEKERKYKQWEILKMCKYDELVVS